MSAAIKVILAAFGICFLALGSVFVFWPQLIVPHPKALQAQVERTSPGVYSGIQTQGPPPIGLSSGSEGLSEPSESEPVFNEQQKQAALELYRDRRKELKSVRPPQIDPANEAPQAMAGEINGFVDEMGRKAIARNQAREALRDLLSAEEQKRVEQKLHQEETEGSQ